MVIERIDKDLCNGCQMCYDDCPMDAIRFDHGEQKAYIAYSEDCVVCFQCANNCPTNAISVSPLTARVLILPY